MKKIYTLIICLGFMQMAFGQVTTNYNAKWFFGVNTGLTWQTTDVSNQFRTGWGLTLGKSFNYNSATWMSFDVRGRFLRGFWYGQDKDTSDFSVPNISLSQGATNYKDTLGYAIHNFQTENYLLNLELVAHFNRFRERTRWDPYIFGGIGLNWSQTYGDYLNRDDVNGDLNLYDWDVNNLSKRNIRNTQDGVYETALDGSSQNSFNFFTSQSLGFGLGYQVGRAVTIGVEHKTTWTNIDHFDGFEDVSKRKNDIYHYTNAYIQFRLFGGRHDEQVQTDPVNENVPPVVIYTQPSTAGTIVSNPNYTIQAKISNVFDKGNVFFVHNGNAVSNFAYNTKSDLFAANVTLVEGENTFVLTGNNQYGTDSKTTLIIYKPEVILPPVVNFVQPNINPITVTDPNYNVVGNVLNVKTKSGVAVTVNGVTRNDFNFNANNGNVTLNLTLNSGNNTVQITGTNTAGTDTKSTVIVYKYIPTVTPPVVIFTDPSGGTKTVATGNYTVKGKVQNVESNSGVSFSQNGNSQSNFSFNPTTDDFSFNATLAAGQNTFILTGTNVDGTASATTIIIYNRQTNPPVVSISNPSNQTTNVSVSQYSFVGSILNITSKSQATLKVNGSTFNSFTFNNSTKGIAATLTLIQGNNTIELSGTNADGSDSKQVNIIYTPVVTVQPPVVYFTAPSSSPSNVNSNSYTLQAKVLNVDGAQNITFKRNGSVMSNFTFNASTDEFTSTQSLNAGQNIFEITGSNSAGSASATTILVYNVATPKPPVVTISNPSGSSATSSVSQYPFVGNITNVNVRSQVNMTVNGTMYNGFNFNAATGVVTANLTLNSGANAVELKGTNADGTDSKQVVIVYTPVATVNPPVVTYVNPGSNPTTVSSANYNVQATVANVSTPGGVNIIHNGSNVGVFNFGNNNLTFTLSLVEGANTITVTGTNAGGVDSKTTTIVYTRPIVVPPPVVTFVNPVSNSTTVVVANYNVKATVLNVGGTSDITVKVNGANTSSFTYNSTTKLVDLNMNLNEGSNTVEITGTNSAGTDSKTRTIVYDKPIVVPPPVVTFVNPVSNSTTVAVATYNVKATVLNVGGTSDITVKVNGANTSSFTYNSTTKLVDLNMNLNEGSNTVEITGTNSAGTDSKTRTIVYDKPVVIVPPVVTFIDPASSPTNVTIASYNIRATVLNVAGTSDITVKVNGVNTNSFTYSSTTKIVTLTANLNQGSNTVEIKGTNAGGSDTKSTVINYTIPCVPPVVSAITPSSSAHTTDQATLAISLSVTGINSGSEVIVKVGSTTVNSSYNASSKIVTATVPLNIGMNSVTVTATNACGTDKFTYKVVRTSCDKPTLSLNFANVANNQTTFAPKFTMVVNVTKITTSSQIQVTLGTKPVPFNFDLASGTIEVDYAVIVGTSSFKVVATNNCGSVEYNHTITRQKSATKVVPQVTITSPASSPSTVNATSTVIQFSTVQIIDKGEIIVKANGVIIPITFSSGTNSGTALVPLASGNNMIEVIVTNPIGSATASAVVVNSGKGSTGTRTNTRGK